MLTFDRISTLRAYFPQSGIPLNESCNLLGYDQPTDGGGGFFYYNAVTTEIDNGGSIIKPTSNSGAGRWVRQFQSDGPVNVNWFGVFPNNIDGTTQLTKLIDYYKNSQTPLKGLKVFFPQAVYPNNGAYVLKNIPVYSGFTFSADQSPTNNQSAFCPVIIRPASGAASLFSFDINCQNACLENLYIDGRDSSGALVTTLITAIDFKGKFNTLRNNNIVFCSKHAVFCYNSPTSSIVGARIENNNFQGMANPALSYFDYLGTLHIISMGDSYIINNEIGSNSQYGFLKNPSRYATAMYANTLSTSVINGNIFENADIGVYWINSVYNACSNNRYEYNASGGLSMTNVSLCVFTGERFTNNAMVRSNSNPIVPIYDDLTIAATSGNNTFFGTIFANIIPGGATTPPFGLAPRYHITNFRDNIQYYNRFVAPYFYLDPNNFHNCINQVLPAIEPKIFDMVNNP